MTTGLNITSEKNITPSPEPFPFTSFSPSSDKVSLPDLGTMYNSYLKVIDGGTPALTLSSGSTPIPSPQTAQDGELVSPDEIQKMWNQVIQETSPNPVAQNNNSQCRNNLNKIKKLEKLLLAALESGNIDLAMLLLSGLESNVSNELAGKLIQRVQSLQQERQDIAEKLGTLKNTPEDAGTMQKLNLQASDVSTDMNLLETFLQDVQDQKKESQQMASNYLHSRHDTAEAILRNIA